MAQLESGRAHAHTSLSAHIGIPPTGDSMTSTVLLSVGVPAVGLALILMVRRMLRGGESARTFELGAVSTRWLSELRRDEPWTRS